MTPIDWIVAVEALVANGAAIVAIVIGRRAVMRATYSLTLARFWRAVAVSLTAKHEPHRGPISPNPRPRADASAQEAPEAG